MSVAWYILDVDPDFQWKENIEPEGHYFLIHLIGGTLSPAAEPRARRDIVDLRATLAKASEEELAAWYDSAEEPDR